MEERPEEGPEVGGEAASGGAKTPNPFMYQRMRQIEVQIQTSNPDIQKGFLILESERDSSLILQE